MTVPAKSNVQSISNAIESTLLQGDLSKLNTDERIQYYQRVCHSLGLNPLTKPFEYITLNGKLTLYAKRDAADQLRKINNISIEIVSQDIADGMLTVHVRATDGSGRKDEDLGVVSFPETLKGEARANTILKAVTKAKRRVTLSISGLGFLDETEVSDIPQNGNGRRPAITAQTETGELISPDQTKQLQDALQFRAMPESRLLKWAKVEKIGDILASRFDACMTAIQNAGGQQ